jgi:hypothetical protein
MKQSRVKKQRNLRNLRLKIHRVPFFPVAKIALPKPPKKSRHFLNFFYPLMA